MFEDIVADDRLGLRLARAAAEVEPDARRRARRSARRTARRAGDSFQPDERRAALRFAHRRLRRLPRWTAVRETIAMSCARSQSGDAAGRPIIACSALGSASRAGPQIVALGGGERGARLVALAVVDDAELIPGEGIVVVAPDGDAQHPLRLLEIGRILGRDQGMAEQGRDQRRIVRPPRPPRAATVSASAGRPDSSRIWPFSSRK